jgi:Domain of unknown function (DUF6306)
MVELSTPVPDTLLLVDHAITRAFMQGALAEIVVSGPSQPALYNMVSNGPVEGTAKPRTPTASAANDALADGKRVFTRIYAACHQGNAMGLPDAFAACAELLSALNEVLEAERAGARVTLATAKEIAGGGLKPLVLAIHRDEARWCGVLTRAIHQLQGAPSPKTGAFYDKAMAIPDLAARLAFLNRDQGWVVRKLKALLPTIRDEAIHADLTAILASHERKIELVAAELPTPDRIGAPS